MNKTAKVIKMAEQDNVQVEIAVIKTTLDRLENNHIAHIEKDMNNIHKKVDKMDTRLWGILIVIIVSTLGTVVAGLLT